LKIQQAETIFEGTAGAAHLLEGSLSKETREEQKCLRRETGNDAANTKLCGERDIDRG